MFDAEIAAALLNRWTSPASTEEWYAYLGVLREGNLQFTHKIGCVGTYGIFDMGACCTESLSFGDGSRALRVGASDSETGWTRWVALQPLPHTRHSENGGPLPEQPSIQAISSHEPMLGVPPSDAASDSAWIKGTTQ